MDPRRPGASLALAALALAGALVATPAASQLDEAIDARTRAQQEGARSQERVDALADETDAMLGEYRVLLQRAEALRVYNRQLSRLLESQQREMASLRGEIDGVTIVGREITPLLLRMIESLDAFVALDVPFLAEERRRRVEALRALMLRADVTDAEKFRRVLEAYQIENDYGRTIEAYEGRLVGEGDARTVTFLRVGRLTLVYQNLDGSESGVWDRKTKSWLPLGGEHRVPIRQGLRIARKQAAPDLLRLPVPTAEDAR